MMNRTEKQQVTLVLGAFVLGLLSVAPSGAQPQDEEIRQTVARISYLAGNVSYARGDDPDQWQAADLNVPLTIGDRIYTGDDGRVELQVHGGFFVRLGPQSDLAALNLTDDTKQWSLRGGTAVFHVRRIGENEVFEIDTPNAAITFERTGQYRLDVDAEGNSRVAVLSGRALAAAGGGQVPLNAGDEMDIDGIDSPRYDVVAIRQPDTFDLWVRERDRRFDKVRSYEHVQADIAGAADLDEYGRWERVPQYDWAWTPTVVEAGWQPYRTGHWVWQDPWGWTWVAAEPWGWAPYHYGRWVVSSSRWYWVPVGPSVRVASYAPALVAFTGGGPGWSASVTAGGGGFIGWFPLAPRDPFNPWWGRRASAEVNVNVTNVTYVNRTYITVVNHNTFVSGGVVSTNIVRDSAVVTTVMRAPVIGGTLPIVPTTASLRLAVRPGLAAPQRPQQAVAARAVVVRVAPPPPPPTFRAKVDVIQRNNGAPVAAATAAKMATEDRSAPRPVAVRPATGEQGRMTLTPKTDNARRRPPEPVAPARGRPPAGPEGAPVPGTQPPSVSRPPSGQPPTIERGRPPEENARPTVAKPPENQRQRPAPPQEQPDRGRRLETPAPGAQPTPVPRPPSGQPPTVERGRPPEENARPTVAKPPENQRQRPAPPQEQPDRGRRLETPAPGAQPTPVPRPPSGQPPTVERGRPPEENARPTVAKPPDNQRQRPVATPRPQEQPERPAAERPERGRPNAGPPPQPAPESQKEKPKEKEKEKEKPKEKEKSKEKPTPPSS
jgi:hypothetical protein